MTSDFVPGRRAAQLGRNGFYRAWVYAADAESHTRAVFCMHKPGHRTADKALACAEKLALKEHSK